MSNHADDPKSSARYLLMTLVLMGLGITLVAAIATAVNTRQTQEILHAEFALTWIMRAIGAFITAVAALGLLLLAILGSPLERMCSLVLPLLGGALLSNFHWAPALALGGIVVALIVKETVPRSLPREPGPESRQ